MDEVSWNKRGGLSKAFFRGRGEIRERKKKKTDGSLTRADIRRLWASGEMWMRRDEISGGILQQSRTACCFRGN